MREQAVELIDISKFFGEVPGGRQSRSHRRAGEFLTLLGPSGCGKTTTLNLIAGFLTPDFGSIRLAGRAVDRLPSFRRDIGIVFQDYALFPQHERGGECRLWPAHAPGGAGPRSPSVSQRALDLVHLAGFGERRPLALSGGQRQRVALARALVIRPTVLLLDEPLSNLDLKLREEMRLEITTLQRRLGITMVMVTHDQGEALAVSDRIAVMNQGRIEQLGDAHSVYENPASRFVADFIGSTNFLPGRSGRRWPRAGTVTSRPSPGSCGCWRRKHYGRGMRCRSRCAPNGSSSPPIRCPALSISSEPYCDMSISEV